MPERDDPPRLGRLQVSRGSARRAGDARKLAGPLADRLDELDDDDFLAVVVKVTEPGYKPAAAERRADLTDTLFTANVRSDRLAELTRDPQVASVELNRRLRRID